MTVSVIMPAYNAEKYVEKAVNSILEQSYTEFDFVITDDCSTDRTYEILCGLKDKDPRIRLFKNLKNSGIANTLNKCIEHAEGELIAVMHADDIALPKRIEVQRELLLENKELRAVGSHCLLINQHDEPIGTILPSADKYDVFLELFLKNIAFPHPSAMYWKAAFLNAGRYSSEYDGLEDLDLWLKLLSQGCVFSNAPYQLMQYRIHGEQTSQNFKEIDLIKNYKIFCDFVNNIGMKTSYDEVKRYSNLCINRLTNCSVNDLTFFLEFFDGLLGNHKFLKEEDKSEISGRLMKKIMASQSKKKLNSYLIFFYLLKWKLRRLPK
jgi:glycosyltransferase involved in cell wall biosynthesis